MEEWAGQKYPELWAHLATMERSEHEDGLNFDGIDNEIWV